MEYKMKLQSEQRTDVGGRDNNEDAVWSDDEQGLFIVADGMGGHNAGEVASAMAIDVVKEILLGQLDPEETRLSQPLDEDEGIRERLRYAMNQASIRIRREADLDLNKKGMGTTLTVLYFDEDTAHISHVGDSRLYLFREGQLTQLTLDHTVVQDEIDAGRLTPELARFVPHKSLLTQSIGAGAGSVLSPQLDTRFIEENDVFMLCSDGLTDVLDNNQLQSIFENTPTDDLVDELIQVALDEKTKDNISVIVIRVSDLTS